MLHLVQLVLFKQTVNFPKSSSGTGVINLVNVSGTFQIGEKIIASDSAETGKIIENSSNEDLTILTPYKEFLKIQDQ